MATNLFNLSGRVAVVTGGSKGLGKAMARGLTEAGADVTGVKVGDEVIVYPVTGAYADYVTAPATSVFPKPAGLGWAEAGSLMLTGVTAVHALHASSQRLICQENHGHLVAISHIKGYDHQLIAISHVGRSKNDTRCIAMSR